MGRLRSALRPTYDYNRRRLLEYLRIIDDPNYTVEKAFRSSIEAVDFSHGTEQLAQRLGGRIEEQESEDFEPTDSLRDALQDLARAIRRFLGS